jgi:hypothetical protein
VSSANDKKGVYSIADQPYMYANLSITSDIHYMFHYQQSVMPTAFANSHIYRHHVFPAYMAYIMYMQ